MRLIVFFRHLREHAYQILKREDEANGGNHINMRDAVAASPQNAAGNNFWDLKLIHCAKCVVDEGHIVDKRGRPDHYEPQPLKRPTANGLHVRCPREARRVQHEAHVGLLVAAVCV